MSLKRAHVPDLPDGHTILIGGQSLKLPVEPALRVMALSISLVVAAVAGAAMMAEWPTLALFWYAPHITNGIVDPIFGKPLNFFLFTLPAWQVLLGWLLTLSLIICAVAIAAAINIDRIVAWLDERPRAKTRTSRFAALAPACAILSGTDPEKTPTDLPGAVTSSKSKL